MPNVIVFMDYANINASARNAGVDVDYGALLDYLATPEEGRCLQEAYAYVPIDPRQDHAMDCEIQQLWDQGFIVKSKVGIIAGNTYKCDFDVEMTLDMVRASFDMRPDLIVLVSGDSDFVPVVLELRNKGIRVEVAAFGNSMSGLLRHRCSGYISLDELVGNAESVIPTWDGFGSSAEFEISLDSGESVEGELIMVENLELPQSGAE